MGENKLLEVVVPYLVTLKSGVSNVALPNGQIAQAGQAAFLSDEQYGMLSPTAITALFQSVAGVATTSATPAITVGAQSPAVVYNPLVEGDNEPSSTTTYLNTPYMHP
jgi:hypothetical protein